MQTRVNKPPAFLRVSAPAENAQVGKNAKAILLRRNLSLSKEAFAWKKLTADEANPIAPIPKTNTSSSFRIDRHVPSRQTSNSCSSSGWPSAPRNGPRSYRRNLMTGPLVDSLKQSSTRKTGSTSGRRFQTCPYLEIDSPASLRIVDVRRATLRGNTGISCVCNAWLCPDWPPRG